MQDPFLVISRWREDESTTPAFRTEVKKNDLNPEWKPIKVTLSQLCNGDKVGSVSSNCRVTGNSIFLSTDLKWFHFVGCFVFEVVLMAYAITYRDTSGLLCNFVCFL